MDFRIEGDGIPRLAALAKRLKEVGDKDLRREVSRGLTRSTRNARTAAKANARQRLPKRGGLAAQVAASRIVTRNRLAGRNPVVQIVGTNADNIRRIDKGTVRHPVFGHPDRWVTQPVRRGWWTDAMKLNARDGRRELATVMDALARKLRG